MKAYLLDFSVQPLLTDESKIAINSNLNAVEVVLKGTHCTNQISDRSSVRYKNQMDCLTKVIFFFAERGC